MSPEALQWIEKLQLIGHIEGGFYRKVYHSALSLKKEQLPAGFSADLPICTHIYFLLDKEGFSAIHRIKSDELWHFYAGDPLIIYEIDAGGHLIEHCLGSDGEQKNHFSWIRSGSWFGARVKEGGNYALVGCTVSPGFDYADFELGKQEDLAAAFPQHQALIRSLTR